MSALSAAISFCFRMSCRVSSSKLATVKLFCSKSRAYCSSPMKRPWSSWKAPSDMILSRTSVSVARKPMRRASRSRMTLMTAWFSACSGSCSGLAASGVYCSRCIWRKRLSMASSARWKSALEIVVLPTLAAHDVVFRPPMPVPKATNRKSTNRPITTQRIQLRYFTLSRRILSIRRLLSLRAARRRREQHCTSRRPGRTTGGRPGGRWGLGGRRRLAGLACALALPALLALALAWSLQPLTHDDLFWHLRTGEWIAAHHRVPLVDPFSYTHHGARWITHEWGFSLLGFLVCRAAGAGGLVLLPAALAPGLFAAGAWRPPRPGGA